MPGLSLVALLAAGAARGQDGSTDAGRDADSAMARYQARTRVIRPCPRGAPGEVVVCARPDEKGKRYRLPLPEEREHADGAPVRGESPRASAAPVRAGGCGVIGGQPYGCTGGLPVIGAVMMVGKIILGLADPDRDHDPPPPMPARVVGAGDP
ncbi:MAG TPA: hypothetical protein VNS79_03090 [Sphingobium sp.]|nr:hypothetical protein [Sphingobium sp.]